MVVRRLQSTVAVVFALLKKQTCERPVPPGLNPASESYPLTQWRLSGIAGSGKNYVQHNGVCITTCLVSRKIIWILQTCVLRRINDLHKFFFHSDCQGPLEKIIWTFSKMALKISSLNSTLKHAMYPLFFNFFEIFISKCPPKDRCICDKHLSELSI